MLRRWLPLLALIAASGCLWDDPYSPRKIPPIEKLPKASTTASTRIDSLGKEILASNPDLGFRPQFFCIGVPALALYHQGTTSIVISEGLVERCKTDSELAAVLSTELAQMAVEARAQASGREVGGNDPPYAPRVHNDVFGSRGDPDMTRDAERARFEQRNPRRRPIAPPRQEPAELAREMMNKAGFSPDDLTKVAPLVRQAQSNPNYDRLIVAPPNSPVGPEHK